MIYKQICLYKQTLARTAYFANEAIWVPVHVHGFDDTTDDKLLCNVNENIYTSKYAYNISTYYRSHKRSDRDASSYSSNQNVYIHV